MDRLTTLVFTWVFTWVGLPLLLGMKTESKILRFLCIISVFPRAVIIILTSPLLVVVLLIAVAGAYINA